MWYVIWTTTGKERSLERSIKRFVPMALYRNCWIPMIVERQKWDGAWIDVEKVMFPGYIFIDTDNPEELYAFLRPIPEFSVLLKEDDVFTPVTEQEELMIRGLVGDEGKLCVSTAIVRGGALHILDGPLKGWERYIVRTNRHKRKAILELEVLGIRKQFSVGLEIIGKS